MALTGISPSIRVRCSLYPIGDKGFGQRQTGRWFASNELPGVGLDQAGQVDQFDDAHEFVFGVGERSEFFFQGGKQLALQTVGPEAQIHAFTPFYVGSKNAA